MKLSEYVLNNNIERTQNLVDKNFVKQAETLMQVSVGEQLADYLTNYGYLANGCVEFYGINSVQQLKSDMITETLYLHKYHPKTINLIAFECFGEDAYSLVSSDDLIYIYYADTDELQSTGIKLNDYILSKIREA